MRGPSDPVVRTDALRGIAAEPWRYDFFHAMRLLENQYPDKPRFGTARRPADEPVRLGQSADMSFAQSSLHAVAPASATSKPRIEVRFFGLFGPNGPLPHHLTEYARQRSVDASGEEVRRQGFFAHELRNYLNSAMLAFQAVRSGRAATSVRVLRS